MKEAQPALVERVQATLNMEGYLRCPSSQALRSKICPREMLSVRKTASAEVMSNLGFPSDTVGLTIGNVPYELEHCFTPTQEELGGAINNYTNNSINCYQL